ncbi:MAG: hypothetical protein CM15mV96_170 [uncultured marine virus]|nr:MAG: hypothetical protein CM15mV96_170 [uncultured marine virus]
MPNLSLEKLDIVREDLDKDFRPLLETSPKKFGKGKNIITFTRDIKVKKDVGDGIEIGLPLVKDDSLTNQNHFHNIANPFAHFRSTDFITNNGEKVLVIEEIQSDYLNYLEDALNLYIYSADERKD